MFQERCPGSSTRRTRRGQVALLNIRSLYAYLLAVYILVVKEGLLLKLGETISLGSDPSVVSLWTLRGEREHIHDEPGHTGTLKARGL